MARQLRLEYAGAIYHVMNRGDRQEAIFLDAEDRRRFLKTLGEACEKAGWQVHAYCLMGNHFHLVVETPQPTLVAGMKWFLGTYTQRFNARHRMRGHLFAGRYKSLLVDGSDDIYLRVDRVLGEWGIRRDNVAGRREFGDLMEARQRVEGHADEKLWSGIRRGWRFGAEDFLERLVEAGVAENANREIHEGDAVAETMEEKARCVIAEFLVKRKVELEELRARRKGDPLKIELAAELRKQTAMSMGWIAKELNAGAPKSVWNAMRRLQENGEVGKRE